MTTLSPRGAGETINRDLEQRYDTVAYAAQANPQSHPTHLATVATLLGLAPPAVETARVLEVGCSDGANLLPMAAGLPDARFVGVDLSGKAIEEARRGAEALSLSNVAFLQQDLATLSAEEPFDYVIAHGFYSWVPAHVRDALLDLARRRLSPGGILFVSLNVYPGCHVREAAWQMLHHHVDAIADPHARMEAARAFARLLAEPQIAQTENDAFLRNELSRIASATDSALFHDDLAVPNEPVYFHQFAAHLARHDLAYLAEAKLSMMTAAGLAPRMQQLVAGMDRLAREQYLDFARLRRFRQSLVCRADAVTSGLDPRDRVAGMHVAAAMTLVRAAAEGRAFADEPPAGDANARAARRLLQWLVAQAPRIVPVGEVVAWQRQNAAEDAGAARPAEVLLAEGCYAGTVDLYTHPPRLASVASERPTASPVARWQARRQPNLTNLRHEPLRLDDPVALAVLVLLDGSRTRSEVAAQLAPLLPDAERHAAPQRLATYLSQFALHGLIVA